jgi:predicted 2-oxoglutarate/Fe(II)-dependent dioxygenase YbiX
MTTPEAPIDGTTEKRHEAECFHPVLANEGCVMAGALQSLEELLEALGESSRFATSGNLAPVLPGLDVRGVGRIGSPVSAADAKRMIATATQAPYGRGEATIVDTNVRRVWQIEPSKLSFRNAEWNTHITAIVDAIRLEFGIPEKVSPKLYKLLVYEKGSFFAPHRDSEKTPGMFATLAVCLPSPHKGGTLIVTHDGRTTKIEFGGENAEFKTQYAAFYADCQHEITPVTAGYRICLVYNLAIAGKRKQPAAPKNAPIVKTAATLLADLFADPSSKRSKLAIPLEHQYTEAGLDPTQLKGADRTRADVLVRAAASLDYQCYLALLTHYQSGAPDYDTLEHDGYRSRHSYRWSYNEDEDDEYSNNSGADMGEVYEEELSLDHWVDVHGGKQPFGEIHLEKCEILSEENKEDWSIKQEIHEATGNEGVSMERWYRQGVIVIWPRDRYFAILAGEGQASAIPALEQMAKIAKKPAAVATCLTFAVEIIGHWKPRQYLPGDKSSYSARMLNLLECVGTEKLVERFICYVLPKDFDGSEGKAVHGLCRRFGWDTLGTAIRAFVSQQQPSDRFAQLNQIVSICEALCCDPPALNKERRAVCSALANDLADVIVRWDFGRTATWYRKEDERTGVVESVVRIFATVGATDQLDLFLAHVLVDDHHYNLHEMLIPAVMAIFKWVSQTPGAQPAASRLLQHCLAKLRAATVDPVDPPKDWTRDANLDCRCEDCRALSHFLGDPAQRVARFALRKDRRQHLHQQIDKHRCDLTHVTERKGSPQTLVCTKTQNSYERRLNQWNVDKKLLAEMESLASARRRIGGRPSTKRRSVKK